MNKKIIDEALRKATKEALESDLDALDFYSDMEYVQIDTKKLQSKKKARSRRRLAIAASFLMIVTLSGVFAILISDGSVQAVAFKLEQQVAELRNLLSPGDHEESKISTDTDSIVLEIESLNEIEKAQDFFPNLIVSTEIPARFNFDSLTVTKNSDGSFRANYVFWDMNQALLTINQASILTGGLSISIISPSETIETDHGTIYIFEDPFGEGTNAATYLTDRFIVDVNGAIGIDEIKNILMNPACEPMI